MNSVPAITTGPMDRYTRPTRTDTAIEAAQILTGVEVESDTPAPPAPAPPAPKAPAKRAPAPPAPKAPAKRKASGSGQASGSGKAPAKPKASGSGLRGR